MHHTFRNIVMAVLMLLAAGVAMAIHPTHRIADDGPAVILENMIPMQFGDWKDEPQQNGHIVNPQVKEKLDRIYTATLSRTYVNSTGDRIMLSIAYGADQSDAKQLHYPEVCYPAQGFQLMSNQVGELKTDFGNIPVRRLYTVLGMRAEPLTYWTTVGNKAVLGSKQTKLEQLRYGFRGKIPDGLLFRVSSITSDADAGYAVQQAFVRALIAALPQQDRAKLAGLSQ
ncbi:exosortase-associated protein EpsI, B-type [Methylotenera sp. N17]|jgi:EpsI family protein|uniref:exosortase-associated protein EpsI, B-type n=1 Tax=Methylotenera sp. N17 TaxID=1502761 RepID=UPI000645C7BC|nr:exosortase-associated protein EpsI, B-type [Methylotenera sp. N17]